MTETTDILCHECRWSIADVETESRGRLYRLLLINPGVLRQYGRQRVECQGVTTIQRIQSHGLLENLTAAAGGYQLTLNIVLI